MLRAVEAVSDGLNEEQLRALRLIASGANVLFTGSAGTGKTHLLNCIREIFAKVGRDEELFVTASTGAAATLIRGTTVHSFAGIGLGKDSATELVCRVKRFKESRDRWRQCKALVIDEVSMISAELFDKLDTVARSVRGVNRPFGGVQLILGGDFYQLPPVGACDRRPVQQQQQQQMEQEPTAGATASFVFESKAWRGALQHAVELKRVYRQSDIAFSSMLDELRRGDVSSATVHRLESHERHPPTHHTSTALATPSADIKATRLYAHNAEVNRVNESELAKLRQQRGETSRAFLAVKKGPERYTQQLLNGPGCSERLELLVGAQVLLTRNLDVGDGLVNGSVGTVVGFADQHSSQPQRPQQPQQSHVHAPGQRQPDGMSGGGGGGRWPVVVFPKSASPKQRRTIEPVLFTIEQGGQQLASVSQVPLKLAWALSIHRCQGMTLDRVFVDLNGVFESGMLYVALSRARSLDGLIIRGFRPGLVMASDKVQRFYAALRACGDAERGRCACIAGVRARS